MSRVFNYKSQIGATEVAALHPAFHALAGAPILNNLLDEAIKNAGQSDEAQKSRCNAAIDLIKAGIPFCGHGNLAQLSEQLAKLADGYDPKTAKKNKKKKGKKSKKEKKNKA